MAKKLASIAALAALLVAGAPVSASEIDRRAIEEIAIDIEALVGTIEGIDLRNLPVKRYDSGISSISIPLSEEQLTRLRAEKATKAADFAALSVGMSLSDPSSTSALIMAANASTFTEYNVWCAVANLRNTDQTKNTTIQMKGEAKVTDSITYGSNSIGVFWISANTPGFKILQLICKVVGGGKAKAKVVPN